MSDPFARIAASASKATTAKAAKGTVVMPVPADAPPEPAEHPTLGKPTATWRYNDADGRLLGYTCRFDSADRKQFRPLTLWRPTTGAVLQWRWENWPEKRPLYGLAGLAQSPRASVLVVEGEKAADAAAKLLPGFVVVTSPNGSQSARKADWSRLRARRVFIWPDADASGIQYALAVAELVKEAAAELVSASKGRFRGTVVKIIQPPADAATGWDAADALHEGWTPERAAELVETAVPREEIIIPETGAARRDKPEDGDDVRSRRRRTPQRDMLVGLTEIVELWHDANRTAYASFHVAGHRENWPVPSRDFRMWLSGRFYEETGAAIGGQALEDALRILEARAVNEGPLHECFNRTGATDGKIYLDLGDATWRAVEITAVGWAVIDSVPVKLMRSPSVRALPVPEAGCLIEELRRFFVNVKSDDDFLLVVAWLVAAFRPHGPFPIIVLNGEAGSGKSVFSRMLRSLVDPSAAPIRATIAISW
jgi:hypothetical protein